MIKVSVVYLGWVELKSQTGESLLPWKSNAHFSNVFAGSFKMGQPYPCDSLSRMQPLI